jgi:apolipoprotein N-acyltransferase
MQKIKVFFLFLLSGLLLGFSWFPLGSAALIFISFIPILYALEFEVSKIKKYKAVILYLASFSGFLLWNLLDTWWVKNASIEGSILAFVMNSILMATVLCIYNFLQQKIASKKLSVYLFLAVWLSFEYLHLNWSMSWTWLNLGNVFAWNTNWIQWYEYTGTFGGSAWIILVNFSFFEVLEKIKSKDIFKSISVALAVLFIPIFISIYIKYATKNNGEKVEVILIQPNIDPYNGKFDPNTLSQQLQQIEQLAVSQISKNTKLIVAPETALPFNIWENELDSSEEVKYFKKFIAQNANVNLLIGASTAKMYEANELKSATARSRRDGKSYDSYNTALYLKNNKKAAIYHKSKLVPGVEIIPFPELMKYFEKYAIDLGGTTGSLGMQSHRTVFESNNSKIKVAPIICYESVYGEFVGEFVKNGANLIAIITNDGWWGDTPGYKQHLAYSKLRAIEQRRSIVRSANTGISAFINLYGEIEQQTNWWEEKSIKANVVLNHEISFYGKNGDYIALLAIGLLFIFILFAIYISYFKKT